jgi:hypothetical protein
MSIAEEPRLSDEKPRRDLWLVGSSTFGPLLWFTALLILYALAARDCPPFSRWLSWGLLAMTMAGCGASLVVLRRLGQTIQQQHDALPQHEWQRARFMVHAGLALNVLSLLLLLGFGMPLLMLRPCE